MKNQNPFKSKVSLLEMANNILEKKQTIRREKDASIKIKRSKSKTTKNSIKAVKDESGEIFYIIPSNMKIAGFKNRINKGIDALNDFKISNSKTITI